MKFFKKNRNSDYNTHKNFNINEFIFDNEVKKNVENLLLKYRDEFHPTLLNKETTTDFGMIMNCQPLIEELKHYFNNDLCISVATSIAITRNTDFNLRTHAYYVENAITRITNSWEYLFIILSQFYQTDLIVGNDIRDNMIYAKCNDIEFVKKGNSYKIKLTPLPEKRIEEIMPSLEREHRLFNISINKKKNVFTKILKQKYTLNDRVQSLLDIYFSEETKEIIALRNEIVHRRSLGAKYSMAPLDFIPGQGVSINQQGWYSFKEIDNKLEKNLVALRQSIQQMINIIFSNEVPNLKSNENYTFIVFKVNCNNCLKTILINDVIVKGLESIEISVICPNCNSENTEIGEKMEVSDRYYFSNLKEYNNFLFDYWKKED
ncbi:hypothetical protein FLK61_41505 [Paenalkalicoccus suaedae]|uniref:Uncharacterized protein n=1 Tax=Paenalkalicoccus suaedae TaxID=2592382 RepID=A0A859FJU6_9BACI|nr:hypothetical protein [Paenalkalicoccus suaedae]QKS73069.1 hypothetical protein FLK61_41505 [Paenalkalicoccus suaedae]